MEVNQNEDLGLEGSIKNEPLIVGAARMGKTATVRRLLELGANPNVRSRRNETNQDELSRELSPLHYACSNCDAEMVEVLLQHGASVNATDLNGETPLYILTEQQTLCATDEPFYLLKNGYDQVEDSEYLKLVSFRMINEGTRCQNDRIVSMIASNSPDALNTYNDNGQAPIHVAAEQSRTCVVRALVLAGADVNLPLLETFTSVGLTFNSSGFASDTLTIAARYDLEEVCEMLLRNGARLNDQYFVCESLYANIFENRVGNFKVASILIRHGVTFATLEFHEEFPRNEDEENFESTLLYVLMNRESSYELEKIILTIINAGYDIEQDKMFITRKIISNDEDSKLSENGLRENVTMILCRYISNPRYLKEICRNVLRDNFLLTSEGRSVFFIIDNLACPNSLKDYLKLLD